MVSRDVRSAFVDLASRLTGGPVSGEGLLPCEGKLLKRYPSFAAWPADGQVALHLMSWVIGPGFHYPVFRQAATKLIPDFLGMAEGSRIPDRGHPGVIALNALNRCLFTNASLVLDFGLRADRVFYPIDLALWVAGGQRW